MLDVQSRSDDRNLPIQKVGVKNVSYPIQVLDRANGHQQTVASIDLFADLPHHFKGTHMSRFIEVFHQHRANISMPNFLVMLEEIRAALDAEEAYGSVRFPYFITKTAPVSGQASVMTYQCFFQGEACRDSQRFFVGVEVPVHTLCPCSKEISRHGAHNQRGTVRVVVQMGKDFFWLEDLVSLVETCASGGLYALLKREDERFVTEHAYENPVFVEDLVRAVTVKLEAAFTFPWFTVEAENQESIHLHEAYAFIERGQKV
jgi:GTP cyclohydrolase I